MSVLAMMFLVWAFIRFGRFHHLRRGHCGAHFDWQRKRAMQQLRYAPPVEPPTSKVSAFDTLKARYVRGAISDTQYESELDSLLRTPEGRRQIL